MRKLLLFILLFTTVQIFAQNKGKITGVITDTETKETIVGAAITYGANKGTVTDINGSFTLELEFGEYDLTVSYLGFTAQTKKVTISSTETQTINFNLESSVVLKEVEIVSEIAKMRETPVAFSTISSKKIEEELSSRDLAMLLNSTPGVYATEQGGGSGDARVTIRGFSQQNVAVLVDGIPVNDMENGAVYWSNWDGIGDVTRNVQVQRGLGASKLAIASVGGTMNTLTRGIESKMGGYVKQEVGNNNMLKTSVGYNSGLLKGNWGFTLALSKKTGDGYVDQTWFESYSYFMKVQKRFKNQTLTFGFNGAPQKHGQRNNRTAIAVIDKKYAQDLGIDVDSSYRALRAAKSYTTPKYGERGLRFNPDWGYGGYYEKDANGVTKNITGPFNGSINFYHKPLLNLTQLWNISKNVFINNSAYLSIGKGGGTGFLGGSISTDTIDGQQNIANDIRANQNNIDKIYSETENKAGRIIRSSNNDHFWYGLLSTIVWKINNHFTYTGGIDLRNYTGIHYRTVYSLLGGDYYVNTDNKHQPIGYGLVNPTDPKSGFDPNFQYSKKTVGDTVGYYNKGFVQWYGAFNQLEYKSGRITAFITANISQSKYKKIDYYAKKDVFLSDTTFKRALGWGDTLAYDGDHYVIYNRNTPTVVANDSTFYTVGGKKKGLRNATTTLFNENSAEAKTNESEWKTYIGFTIKGGLNFNIDEHNNIFANVGYISLPPQFVNVFDNTNKEYLGIKNQTIQSVELGYGLKFKKFAANVNAYYTDWAHKPTTRSTNFNGETVSYNITEIGAIHQGVEFDFIYKILTNLELEGLASIGDWRYYGSQKAYIQNQDAEIIDSVDFSAERVHVGNAAQSQLAASVRYEPFKGFYLKPRITWFGNNYADFDPINLSPIYDKVKKDSIAQDNRNRDSWQMPNYYMLDLYTGYQFKYHDLGIQINASVINLLDARFLTDAQNGANFDAFSALVYFGQGRRYNVGLKVFF
jgi:hypothetical protein